jgi:mercuric ion transport protein
MINKFTWRALIGVLGASFLASVCCVCCIGPLLLVALGVGGAGAGYITFFAPYRPYIIVLVVLSLSYSFYKLYINPPHCGFEASCISPKKLSIQRWIFWIITILSIGFLYFSTC